MKRCLLLLFSLLSIAMFAQQKVVTGKVLSATDREPIIGVSIRVEGSPTLGCITDVDGNFKLQNVPNNATLTFSMIGYKSQSVALKGRSQVNVILDEDVSSLDEVVVIGYGAVKKSDLTSSISTVKGSEIASSPGGNAMMALQGKAAGVQISNSGGPGDVPRVIIRGVTTVNGSDPLYVVDGMPVGNDINFLNQNDIESIEILKDASASAIYGTRGSNGVILITTKKGSIGKVAFEAEASFGWQTLKNPKMAKASEFEKVFKARYTNDGDVPVWNSKDDITDAEGTDWWKETVKGQAIVQSYNISFRGGTEKLLYSGSIGYYRQNSQFTVGYWDKITSRFNTEYQFNKIIKVGMDFAPNLERWDDTPTTLFDSAMRIDPTTPVFKPQSEWVSNEYNNYARSYNNQVWNPVAMAARQDAHSNEYGLLMTPYINVEPLKGFTLRTQFGVNARFRTSDSFTPSFFIDNLEQNPLSDASRTMNTWVDWNWTNTASYIKTFKEKHNLNLMGGYTMEKFSNYWLTGSRESTPSNLKELRYVSAGTMNQKASGTNSYTSLMSYLGRVMYNYDDRYYVTASVRIDGSSKFPKGEKYATFPSASVAWRITGEPFMKGQKVFDNLKLRLGWGRVGNQEIDSNAYLNLISASDYVFGTTADRNIGTSVSNIGNTNLKWETVEDYDLGLDMTLFNNRLDITADIYQKKSHDMLLQKDNMLVLGYPMWNGQMWTNVGSMKATGWELSFNWHDKIRDFAYSVGLNLASVKNKAIKLLGADSPIYTGDFNSDYIIRNDEGAPISRFYGYVTDGLFQTQDEVNTYVNNDNEAIQPYAMPGDIRFKDLNKDGYLDEKDKTFIGNPFPDLMLGLNTQIAYKNLDLIANFYGTFGNDIFNTTRTLYSGKEGNNVKAGAYDKAWHGEGTSNDIPRFSVNDLNNNYRFVSDFFVEDGSYLRCKLLQLGYTFPKSFSKLVTIRLSFSVQNLFTITHYSGMDPERASMGGVTESGIDWVDYPNPRNFLVGVKLNF